MLFKNKIMLSQTEKDVFNLLKKTGPLCSSQISVELLTPVIEIIDSLNSLKELNLIKQKPDSNKKFHWDESETPWGLY